MSGAESSAASWTERWGQRLERLAQPSPVRALGRWVVGDDVEGELRVVDAARLGAGPRVRAPVLVLGFITALAAGQFTGLGPRALVAGALIGWAVGRRVYRGAVGYSLPDATEVRFTAEDMEVGNWLKVRRGGLVRRAARVTGLEDAGAAVRVRLSNGQVREWPWRRRVPVVLLELPCPPRSRRGRCLYAVAQDELLVAWGAWGLPRCGGPVEVVARRAAALRRARRLGQPSEPRAARARGEGGRRGRDRRARRFAMTAGPGAMEGLDARLVAAMRSSYRPLRVVGRALGAVVTGWAVGVAAGFVVFVAAGPRPELGRFGVLGYPGAGSRVGALAGAAVFVVGVLLWRSERIRGAARELQRAVRLTVAQERGEGDVGAGGGARASR